MASLSLSFLIRPERASDAAAVDGVLRAAFAGQAHSDQTEHLIVARLRAHGRLALSLVAGTADGVIVGHAAFSPVSIGGRASDWMGLGPLAVLPGCQRMGVGAALVRAGLAELARRGAGGCVVLGEPAYYRRFGFAAAADAGLCYPPAPAAYFMALPLAGKAPPAGVVGYDAAFG